MSRDCILVGWGAILVGWDAPVSLIPPPPPPPKISVGSQEAKSLLALIILVEQNGSSPEFVISKEELRKLLIHLRSNLPQLNDSRNSR